MSAGQQEYKFSDIIADPLIRERWEKVRRFFFLRESTYDMSNRCNIRCEGCYYFTGEKQFADENSDKKSWRKLLESEKKRGITFVVLAGAEPSLVPELCQVCYEVIPLGTIASNGLKPVPKEIDYQIHISVWGNDQTSQVIRKAPDMLVRQMANYKDDSRAVFVYTFTPVNIDEARQVTRMLAENGQKITFNMFSSPVGYKGHLRHSSKTLEQTRLVMSELLSEYPQTVLFSSYNIAAHTDHVLKELEKELVKNGSSMDKVLKVSVFLHDLNDYHAMNKVFRGRFGENPPVRTTVATYGGVPGISLVEIDCIASLD